METDEMKNIAFKLQEFLDESNSYADMYFKVAVLIYQLKYKAALNKNCTGKE